MGEEEREREGEEEVVAKAAHEGEPGRPGSANGSGPRRRPAPLVRHTASSDINSIVGVSSVAVRKPEAILTYSKIVRSFRDFTGYKSRSMILCGIAGYGIGTTLAGTHGTKGVSKKCRNYMVCYLVPHSTRRGLAAVAVYSRFEKYPADLQPPADYSRFG